MPRKATPFEFTTPSGKHLSLSQYKGKVVLFQFLYTTCPHCQHLAGELTTLQQKYGSKGLQVLGVAFNEESSNPQVVNNFVQQFNVGFPVGMAAREAVQAYLGISTIQRFVVPQIMLISRTGEVVAQSEAMGSPELQDPAHLSGLIEGLLKEGHSTSTSRRKRTTSKRVAASQ
ncbi:MAG TPA: TlpA disulfide reductase family protein [Bryobacteraceae bacterium]|nr:TlpA disulfide reductase family protein [Bryobacteraceae bacterium]